MIDVKALEKDQEYFEQYKNSFVARGGDASDVEALIEANKKRKVFIQEAENAKAEQNKVSQEIAKLKREKKDANELLQQMQKVSKHIKEQEAKAAEVDAEVHTMALNFPNILDKSVPTGTSEADNRIEKTVGEPKKFSFKALDHADLGDKNNFLDFERAGKVSGSRFAFLKGFAARLERVLIQFMMDIHADEHAYEEMIPPYIVNSNSMLGTGQFPKFKDDVFWISNPEFYLIPTAEVPVTNYYSNEILKSDDLPKNYVAFSPSFRSEAGSYGKDTKGLIRQHQFHKVELVKFTHPEESEKEHEKLTSHAETILERLELPYRRSTLCSGDIGFGARKCYDLEVWLPGQEAYREISSCSNFGDFQARRANIRFRPGPKEKPQYVHTLNGSGLAVGRALIAILENYQKEDGSIEIPSALKKYF